jgi:hypothetical protein
MASDAEDRADIAAKTYLIISLHMIRKYESGGFMTHPGSHTVKKWETPPRGLP